MQRGPVRLPVLPRDVAAAVTVSAAIRGVWAVALAVLAVTIPGVVDYLVGRGYYADAALAAGILLSMIAALLVLMRWPSRESLATYLIVGTLSVWAFQFLLLSNHPEFQGTANFLLNRPAFALVLVGSATSRPLNVVKWGVIGFVLGEAVTVLVDLQLGLPITTGLGPAIAIVIYCATFLVIYRIQQVHAERVPEFDRVQADNLRYEAARTVEQRAAAAIHDTLLNDLALVIHGPEELSDHTRDRMRDDVAWLSNGQWMAPPAQSGSQESDDAMFRNQLMAIASDFQWRGLGVEVTGNPESVLALSPDAATAALGAVRACLENVVKHSGSASAELILDRDDELVTIMVVDSGRGFDPGSVGEDRLGLRSSVRLRVESQGGAVRVWSSPGSGTSVVISLPVSLGAAPTEAGDRRF
ncbi:sensor histidine kinase [Glaciihabitans sp. dw_435]|uniref:sensor histidine kinase n=1 Tax=Glaciihabitans sp. dw_435 TaxID=2720081 RepID=UPI001BD46701|nr:ATP-binding protein [Glaciihabitans sp. dw_435]